MINSSIIDPSESFEAPHPKSPNSLEERSSSVFDQLVLNHGSRAARILGMNPREQFEVNMWGSAFTGDVEGAFTGFWLTLFSGLSGVKLRRRKA